MFRSTLFSLMLVASVSAIAVDLPSDYTTKIQQQRAERDAGLRKPGGWLSLIGLDWLSEGRNSIGSAKDNDIVLLKGPPKLGVITLQDGKASITIDAASGATVDGKTVAESALASDAADKPSIVAAGPVSFFVIQRNDKIGLRIKDADADALKHFLGIDFFAIDPSWRVEARWVTFDKPRPLEIPDVVGTIYKLQVPGKAVFEHAGVTYELLPMNEDTKDGLFFVFADKTSGKITYGGGRFLDTDAPKDGKLILDFNLAYDPPCAFTPYATCPLAPPENRLKVAVNAGEKKYRGGAH
ncbi:MAG: DUF1684 domain-containing protein [Dokdonella sp.]